MTGHLVEVDPAEFMCVNAAGSIVIKTPPNLTIDQTQCARCSAFVGFNLDEWQGADGADYSGLVWTDTYRTADGTYICEDCAGDDRGE